jgi:hypothetical protein
MTPPNKKKVAMKEKKVCCGVVAWLQNNSKHGAKTPVIADQLPAPI